MPGMSRQVEAPPSAVVKFFRLWSLGYSTIYCGANNSLILHIVFLQNRKLGRFFENVTKIPGLFLPASYVRGGKKPGEKLLDYSIAMFTREINPRR